MRTDEYKKKVIEYLMKNMDKGYDMDTLKWALIRQGYSRSIVDWAIIEVHKELANKAPLLQEKPEISIQAIEESIEVSEPKKSFWKRLFG